MGTEKPFDALIIGSGLGGLSCGILLSLLDRRVAVIERNPLPGGLMRSYVRQGLDCPVGVHYFGAFAEGQPLRRMFDYLGVTGSVEVERMGKGGPIDRYIFDDFTFDLPEGLDAFADALEAAFPGDRRAIAEILANLRSMSDLQHSLSFLSPAIPILNEDLVLPLSLYLEKRGCSARLRSVLSVASRWMGLPEQECPVLYHHLALASYLMSAWRLTGSGSDMTQAFVSQLEKRGGILVCNDPVTAILAEGKTVSGVRLASGRTLHASRIVAAIHPKAAIRLLPEGTLKSRQVRRILDLADTEGLFAAYAAVDAETSPALPYNLYRLHGNREGWLPSGVFCQLRPGRRGKNLLTMITNSPFHEWRRWEGTVSGQRGMDYRGEKARRSEGLLATAREILGPLEGAEMIDAFTPLTVRDFTDSPCGSPYGVMRSARQFPAMASLHRRPVEGLFFAGQNALAPGVLGTVLGSFQAVRQMIGQECFDRDVFAGIAAG